MKKGDRPDPLEYTVYIELCRYMCFGSKVSQITFCCLYLPQMARKIRIRRMITSLWNPEVL